MTSESLDNFEKEPRQTRFLSGAEKIQYRSQIEEIIKEYPDQFFPEYLNYGAFKDYGTHEIVCAFEKGKPIGCLFLDTDSHECNWLAVSKSASGFKQDVALELFATVFESVPPGTRVWWYVNAEDSVFDGNLIGQHFESARQLYKSMGSIFTKVENKFGEGNHAYLVEYTA